MAVFAYAEATITIPDVQIASGQSAVLAVTLSGDQTLWSIGWDITLANGITTTEEDIVNGEIAPKLSPMMNPADAPLYRYGATSTAEWTAPNGVLMYITIHDDGSHNAGDVFECKIENIELSDGISTTVYPASSTFKVTITDRVILDENTTIDPVAADGVNVTVNRTIKANEWSTIVLPFNMTKAKAETAFGSDVQLAEFAGFVPEYASDEDVTPDAITVNFTTVTMNPKKGMTGGKPYIIKTSTDITTFDVDGVNIANTITPTTARDEFDTEGKFTGSYKKTVVPVDGLFLNDNKFWYSTGKTNIKAFRGWLELGAVLDKETDFGVKLNIIVDGEETKIDGINSENTNDAVYTLDGKYVGKDMNRLRKGIYIQNGKKVVK